MLYGYTKKSIENMCNPGFYLVSCVSNMLVLSLSYFVVPVVGKHLAIFGTASMLVLILEFSWRGKRFTESVYNTRYVIQIIIGAVAITSGIVFINKDYMLYLPILMGMMYFAVNTIIRSQLVQYTSIGLMVLAPAKILITQPKDMLEYMSVVVLFTTVVVLTTVVFRTNKERLEDVERTSTVLRGTHYISTHLMTHDVRNTLQEMQSLALPRYRNSTTAFLYLLQSYSETIDKIVSNNAFDEMADVSIADVVNSLNHLTTTKRMVFSYIEEDDACVVSVKNVVYSILKNFIENSCEAADRIGIVPNIVVAKTHNKVTITDNCGGFDVSGIRNGYTSKTKNCKNHGVFLRTVTDTAMYELFGFCVDVARIHNGTKIVVKFKEAKSK